MPGHIEPLCGLLRVGGAYGEPWTWAAVLKYDGPASVVVSGVERPPTPSEWRAAVQIGKDAGITSFRFLRAEADGFREHLGTTETGVSS